MRGRLRVDKETDEEMRSSDRLLEKVMRTFHREKKKTSPK